MIDEPVPTIPEMVPASRPTMRMKRKPKVDTLRWPRAVDHIASRDNQTPEAIMPTVFFGGHATRHASSL
jgi:hypothetical protein